MSSAPRGNRVSQSIIDDLIPLDEAQDSEILEQDLFLRMLSFERKRTERSGRRFVLMLLEWTRILEPAQRNGRFENVFSALSRSTRQTDIKGWYKEWSVVGVLFTEIGDADERSVANALLHKLSKALRATLTIEEMNEISVSFHVFPESAGGDGSGGPLDPTLYPDLVRDSKNSRLMKRSLDIVGSLFGLILFSPFILAISAVIKLTSRGPVFFRQERVGRDGQRFTFLKFRSMYVSNDHTIHREYVTRFISGTVDDEEKKRPFKLTNDPRVTPIGGLLRKTSLDEVPQFLNVLFGHMSLVGPRPPVPYEFECYQAWHRQRLRGVTPGITGLWQVWGRSRVTFDDMVRLDIRYARASSFWLDLKILLRTPEAVLSRNGAY